MDMDLFINFTINNENKIINNVSFCWRVCVVCLIFCRSNFLRLRTSGDGIVGMDTRIERAGYCL